MMAVLIVLARDREGGYEMWDQSEKGTYFQKGLGCVGIAPAATCGEAKRQPINLTYDLIRTGGAARPY